MDATQAAACRFFRQTMLHTFTGSNIASMRIEYVVSLAGQRSSSSLDTAVGPLRSPLEWSQEVYPMLFVDAVCVGGRTLWSRNRVIEDAWISVAPAQAGLDRAYSAIHRSC